jgi:hypothetical protein
MVTIKGGGELLLFFESFWILRHCIAATLFFRMIATFFARLRQTAPAPCSTFHLIHVLWNTPQVWGLIGLGPSCGRELSARPGRVCMHFFLLEHCGVRWGRLSLCGRGEPDEEVGV